MIYKFGDYEIRTSRHLGNLFTIPHYDVWIYYKKYVIAEAHFHFKESYALSWAEYEIISHKQNLKRLEKAINV